MILKVINEQFSISFVLHLYCVNCLLIYEMCIVMRFGIRTGTYPNKYFIHSNQLPFDMDFLIQVVSRNNECNLKDQPDIFYSTY